MKTMLKFFLWGILISSAIFKTNVLFAQDEDYFNYDEKLKEQRNSPQFKYYSDLNHWDIYMEPIIKKENDSVKADAMGIQYAYYTIGRYWAAIPKNSQYKKPSPIFDYSTTSYKLPIYGKDHFKMAAIRKIVFPYAAKFADNVPTDSIINSFVVETMLKQYNDHKADFIVSELDWQGYENHFDYNSEIPDFSKLESNSIIKQFHPNIYVLRPHTLNFIPLEYRGRQIINREMFEAIPEKITVFNSYLFCHNTSNNCMLYLIQDDKLIELPPQSQLKNPNDKLYKTYPRGIMVNDLLTSDKRKILSYLKEDSYLHLYYNKRTDKYPPITIEGEHCIHGQDDYFTIDEFYEDYWNGDDGCGLDYLGDVFAQCAKLGNYGKLTGELTNIILEVNNLREKADRLYYDSYSQNDSYSQVDALQKKADELENRFYKLIQQELKSQGVVLPNAYGEKNPSGVGNGNPLDF